MMYFNRKSKVVSFETLDESFDVTKQLMQNEDQEKCDRFMKIRD